VGTCGKKLVERVFPEKWGVYLAGEMRSIKLQINLGKRARSAGTVYSLLAWKQRKWGSTSTTDQQLIFPEVSERVRNAHPFLFGQHGCVSLGLKRRGNEAIY